LSGRVERLEAAGDRLVYKKQACMREEKKGVVWEKRGHALVVVFQELVPFQVLGNQRWSRKSAG
jgi:hypothetical protein